MLTTPYVSGLSLANDTGTPGDGITSDVAIQGTFEDPDYSGYYYTVEVDVDGDGNADDYLYPYPGDGFQYDPAPWISFGSNTVSFRAIEDGYSNQYVGSWQSISFTYENANIVADVTGLSLVNDTDTPGDTITKDPRIQGTLTDPDMLGFYYQVEFAQAVFLLLFPMVLLGANSLRVARNLRRQELTIEAVSKALHRCRLATQVIGMFAILVTSMWGMYQNLSIGVLG